MMGRIAALAGLALLAACGNQGGGGANQLQMATAAIGSLFAERQAPVNLRTALTREQIDASETSLLLAEVPIRAGQALMSPVVANGNRLTWGTADGITITTQNGFVVATRGLGADLFGADIAGTMALLRSGGASRRIHDLITGDDSVERRSYSCEISVQGSETITIFGRAYATTKVSEICRDDRIGWENIYWIDGSGTMRKSQQWVSEDVQYILIERLR